jgi:cytochrome P450
METEQLLWIAVATIVFVATILRRSTRHSPYTPLQPTILISDPDVARRTLFDHADAFSNHPTKLFPLDFPVGPYRSITTMPYGPAWRTLRCNLTADILHPTRLSSLMMWGPAQRDAVVESFVAGLSAAARSGGDTGGGEVTVRYGLRHAACTLIAHLCFGDGGFDEHDVRAIDTAQLEFLLAYADAKAVENTRLPRVVYLRRWRRLDAAFYRVSKVMITLIAAARRRRWTMQRGCCGGGGGGLSYVDSLFDLRVPYGYDGDGGEVQERRGGRLLADAEVIPLVWEFMLAGTENVAGCVEWALAHLVARPEVQDKLRRELTEQEEEQLQSTPPYLRAVILECLRMNPVVPFLTREIGAEAAPVAAGGEATAAPAGTGSSRTTVLVKVDASDIGRNGDAWSDADEFRPDRFLAGGEAEGVALVPGPKEIKMVAFGAGGRHCPGAKLGMLHVGCLLAAAVREFEWATPAAAQGGGGGVDFTAFDMFFSVMKTPLRARITPRSKT